MGYDAYAMLFAGIRAVEAVERITQSKPVTKYNEDTGEPYQKSISKLIVNLFGKPVADPTLDWGSYGEVEEELNTVNKALGTKLQVCCPAPEGYDEQLIGHSLGQIGTGEESNIKTLATEQIEAALQQVQKELNIAGHVGCAPQIFLVFEESI